jgi:hypothetical protein
LAATAAFAADANIGTWKLNEAKSKISAGAPKNTNVVYEMVGDTVKVTVTGVDADGKSRTVTTSGTNAKGEKISTSTVYDKQ